jgi:tRNA modification GTPase
LIKTDTIIAVATPTGSGGIGVIRLSGPEALEFSQKHFTPLRQDKNLTPREAIYGKITDPETQKALDYCLATYFPNPNSYTGEDVVEFSCHGSRPILRRVIDIFLKSGVRHAGPGEFTLRAVINGRMDLTRAEAVNRLIRADTLIQAEQAMSQLEGNVQKTVLEWENRLLDIIARMEAEVDFAEEEENFVIRDQAMENLARLENDLKELVDNFQTADLLRDGARIVLAGKSNAGKSTLFNSILNMERSIVDDTPGTTRDYITERIQISGVPVELVDTAGLRIGGEKIEREGMRRAEKLLQNSDLVLLVTEKGKAEEQEELDLLAKLKEWDKEYIVLRNKEDLEEENIFAFKDEQRMQISALKKTGIKKLMARVKDKLGLLEIESGKEIITEVRQQQIFKKVLENVKEAHSLFQAEAYDEIVLEELNNARRSLREITGRGSTEDVLNRIFSSFCIGK